MLYRIVELGTSFDDALDVQSLVENGVLVPVEPCEHDNYARHAIVKEWLYSIDGWCVGAALKGDG